MDLQRSSESVVVDPENIFSFKRYFINNLDSYHGKCILAQVANILERNNQPSVHELALVSEDAEPEPPAPPPQPYEIIGTVSDENVKKLENVARIIPKADVIPVMLTCGTVVLDISYDREELRTAMEYLKLLKLLLEKEAPEDGKATKPDDAGDALADESNKRHLILISTVMTWAATKPLDPDTQDLAFIETDFRKRKPHMNYKLHYDCENEVIGIARKYRSQIGAIVVATGVTYGGKEDVLYYWFQKAWECEKLLPILGRGGNYIPLINVFDLAQVIYGLVTDFPKKLYILAVEQNITKQREIVKPLGRIVGTGMFKCIAPEDAFLIKEIDQRIYDLMNLNLNMEPTFISETMGIPWTSDLTFAENVPMLMKQFKKERGLRPFKVVIYGPPIVGKTTLAKQLAHNYGLMYVSPETVAQDVIDDLTWRLKHWEEGELVALGLPLAEDDDGHDSSDEDAVEEDAIENAKTTLALLQSGRPLLDEEIMTYIRERLLSHEAMNKGWVLDGFITSLQMCSALFEKTEDDGGIEEEEKEYEEFEEDADLYANVMKRLLPDLVVFLDATDDFICEKAMRQPEYESRLDEEVILKRLTEFRAYDARDITPLNFFDELDIHPFVVTVNDHTDYAMKSAYASVSLRMGRPSRYPKLMSVIEALEKEENDQIEAARKKEEKALRELEKKMKEEREDKMEYWSELYALIREEEEAALALAGQPMRHYLVNHIFPTLTPALLEVAKLRPDDPIDFLAEYLFKQNPSGKMLEPGYNLQAEYMLGKIKILDDAMKDMNIIIDPLLPPPLEIPDNEEKQKKILHSMSGL